MYTVYMHENMINGKKYIGITSNSVEKRWKNGYGYSRNLKIGRAIEKYGWDNFEHHILYENLTEDEAKKIEKELISDLKTQDDEYGYNITSGGDGMCGWHPTEAARKKMSDSAKKLNRYGENNPNYGHRWTDEMKENASHKVISDEQRKILSECAKKRTGDKNPFYGRKHSDESKKKMSEYAKTRTGKNNSNYGKKWSEERRAAAKGRKMSDEAKRKISERNKLMIGNKNPFYGKRHSEDSKRKISEKNSKKVSMYDTNFVKIMDFNSVKEAAKYIGKSSTSVCNCCNGKTHTCSGYIFKYTE